MFVGGTGGAGVSPAQPVAHLRYAKASDQRIPERRGGPDNGRGHSYPHAGAPMIGKLSRSILAATVVLPSAAACTSSPADGQSRRDVVAAYVDAIQQGDKSRLVELNNPALDQVGEIDAKIAA